VSLVLSECDCLTPHCGARKLLHEGPGLTLPLCVSAAYTLAAGFSPPLTAITEAQKCAKYAVSSLGFEDVSTAVRYLQDALRLLTQPS
jgi:Vta1 C-terminal domain